ncbi:MAG: AAA family ATPase [Bacteroidota bacterium]
MKSPFKFLDSYTPEDRSVFFGRNQEITDLYRRVFESKMLLVYGISGTGKSSLVNCGLASRFDESDWLPVNVRRGNNIGDSLNDAFSKQALTPLKKNQTTSEKLQSIYLDHFKPVYLLFDQFEELFIFGSQEEKKEFISTVKELTESETQCRIIFIIREEFLAGMTEFEEKLPDIFTNRFRVEKMKRTNAISAVEGPCRVYGIETEQGFSEELIDKLCPAGNEIELTYLQIYLDRIFRIAVSEEPATSNQEPAPRNTQLATRNIKFSKDLLTQAGSVSDLLGQFLDEQIREFEDPETSMSILKSFVSVQGTKKQMSENDIFNSVGAFGIKIFEPDLIKYLEKFVELRILRERDEAGHFELRHDALASKIYEHFTLTEKELLEIRQFVENAYQSFKTRKTYLSKDDLEYLEPYEKKLFLSPDLDHFVKSSKVKLQSRQLALKRLTRIVLIIFIGLIALGIRYYVKQRNTQEIRDLTAAALLQEQVDPLTSINTAFRVREEDTLSPVIQGIILRSFHSLLNEKLMSGDKSIPGELLPVTLPVNDSICSLKSGKSGTKLYGWTTGREIIILDLNDSQSVVFRVHDPVLTIEISDDDRYLGIIYQNNTGEVYNVEGQSIFGFTATSNHLMNERLVCFFPESNYFMAAVNDNIAEIYDSTGLVLYRLEGHTGKINSLDISSDGRFVATASSDKSSLIWNYNHDLKRFSPYDTIASHLDTIWSCEFNSTGKYVLTASADSMIGISDLNGNRLDRTLNYASNAYWGRAYFFPSEKLPGETKEDHVYVSDTLVKLDSHNKGVYDARFVSNDRAIISSNYSYDKILNNNYGLFRSEVVYFGLSFNLYSNYDYFLYKAKRQTPYWDQQYIRRWEISPSRLLFAAMPEKSKTIILTAVNGYRLMNLNGCCPVFTSDNRYLYYLSVNKLFKICLDPEEIKSMVYDQKIFGDTDKGSNLWLLL